MMTSTLTRAAWELWDNQGVVATFSGVGAGSRANRTAVGTGQTSPDTGRRLSLYDPEGRLVALYIDGREQVDPNGNDGSAFPIWWPCPVSTTERIEPAAVSAPSPTGGMKP